MTPETIRGVENDAKSKRLSTSPRLELVNSIKRIPLSERDNPGEGISRNFGVGKKSKKERDITSNYIPE